MIGPKDEGAYFGVANIDTVRTDLFLVHLNELEVATTYFGNAYINGFTKEKIYTLEGPEFGEWEVNVFICVR